jgi:hypothetical protein
MNNKRGQATQVFFYVIMVLIVGLVLLLGYKGIGALLETGEETGLIEFRNDIQSAVKKGASYGRISTFDFNTGSDYEQMCFIDRDALKKSGLNIDDAPPLVADAVKTSRESEDEQDDNNVFLLRGDEIQPILTDPLEMDDAVTGDTSFKCFELSSGRISMKFRGRGDATIVLGRV